MLFYITFHNIFRGNDFLIITQYLHASINTRIKGKHIKWYIFKSCAYIFCDHDRIEQIVNKVLT